jgi:MFS family permease
LGQPKLRIVARSEDRLLASPSFLRILACALAYFTAQGIVQPEIPRYVVYGLSGNGAEVGIAVAAYTFSACSLRSTGGRMAARRGSRFVIVTGTAVVTVSLLLYNAASSLPVLVACRLLSGVGEAGTYVGLAKITHDIAPTRQVEATSYFTVSLFGGFAIGPVMGEAVRRSFGFHVVWLVAAACALTALVFSLGIAHPPGEPGVDATTSDLAPGRAWYRDLIQKHAVGPATILAVAMAGYAGLTTLIPLYVAHLGLTSAGPVLAENAVIVLLIRLFGAKLPAKLGALRSTTCSLVLQAGGWAMVAGWASREGLYAGVALIALGVSLLYPALFSFAVNRAPVAERANAVATFTMFFDLANGLGALLLGTLVTLTGGERGAFIAAGALNLAGLLLMGLRLNWVRAEPVAVAGS